MKGSVVVVVVAAVDVGVDDVVGITVLPYYRITVLPCCRITVFYVTSKNTLLFSFYTKVECFDVVKQIIFIKELLI